MSITTTLAEILRSYFFPVLFLLFASYIIFNRYGSSLRVIPGPFLASLTNFWRMYHSYCGIGHEDYLLHQKYNSPVLRTGPRTVAIADPEAIRIIYGWKPVFRKSQIYTTQSQLNSSGQLVENLASTMDEEKHTRQTRPVANAYAMSTLVDFEPSVNSTTEMFIHQMTERFVKPAKECDLGKWLQMYAFEVVGELTFSKRFGFLETGLDMDNMMYHTGNFMDYTGVIGQVPNLDWYFRIKNPILHALRPTSNISSFTTKQIQDHENSPQKNNRDFLSRFLEARQKYPHIVDMGLVHDYANTNVAGGSDTTAVIFRTLVFELATQPRILDAVLGEINNVLKARGKDVDIETPISWAEGSSMTYYQACLKEALRYHPATAQILPRLVPKGGVEICGFYLPEGTNVGCNAWTVHRDQKLYGQDAGIYRPERWLEASSEQAKKMETLLFTFGAGKRACVGKNIAMLELTKFIPEFFRRLEVEVIDPGRYKTKSTWLAIQSGLDVRLRARSSKTLPENK